MAEKASEKAEFMDTKEASKFLKVSINTLRSYTRRGLLLVYKSRSGKVYYNADELREFITR